MQARVGARCPARSWRSRLTNPPRHDRRASPPAQTASGREHDEPVEIYALAGYDDWITSLSACVIGARAIVASGGNGGATRIWDVFSGDQFRAALLDDCVNVVLRTVVDDRPVVVDHGDDCLVRMCEVERGALLHCSRAIGTRCPSPRCCPQPPLVASQADDRISTAARGASQRRLRSLVSKCVSIVDKGCLS